MISSSTDRLDIIALEEDDPIPMELLALTDASPEFLRVYLPCCFILVAKQEDVNIGVMTLCPENREKMEVGHLAVHPAFRRQGVARLVLEEARRRALRLGYKSLQVCISNAHTKSFQRYQQYGFALTDVRWHYYTDHYPQPIEVDGIPCRHQFVLNKSI